MTGPKNVRATTLFGRDLVGTTYTEDEWSTSLYLENAYLRRKLQKGIAPSTIKRPSSSDIESQLEYDVARAYMRRTAGGGPRHLVLANEYPDLGSEYGNGFVHKRVQGYRTLGAEVDVMAFGKRRPVKFYDYEGVSVLSGYVYELLALLAERHYDSVSIHFLNNEMWNVLAPYAEQLNITVFLHGYEVDGWIRRAFDHSSAQALENSIERTHQLRAFWSHVVDSGLVQNYVFVSDWWRRAVSEDMGLAFPRLDSRIIHNFVDTSLFAYEEKPNDHRFRLLWVRSAHAKKYGADMAVAILEGLRNTPYWSSIEVTVIGDGEHFDLFEEAFSGSTNVDIQRRFASQGEIARLHKSHGFFLVPSRLDSQGVSRDEAMSSGLVPITNPTTAIPEFVDPSCAVIFDEDDCDDAVRQIVSMLEAPAAFQAASRAAAHRARSQVSFQYTVAREAVLLGMVTEEGMK